MPSGEVTGMTDERLQQIDDLIAGPHRRAFYGQSMLKDLRAEVARLRSENAALTERVRAAEETAKRAEWDHDTMFANLQSQMAENAAKDAEIARLHELHVQELLALEKRVGDFRKWMNCGGAPTDKTCSVDGHNIYGAFVTDYKGIATCELHYHRQVITGLTVTLRSIEAMLGTLDHSEAVDEPNLASRVTNGVASLLERLAAAQRENFHGNPCYYCGEPINNLAANPGKWGIPLCHADEPGKVKAHHIGCVSERLAAVEVVREEAFKAGCKWERETNPQLAAAQRIPGLPEGMRIKRIFKDHRIWEVGQYIAELEPSQEGATLEKEDS